MTPQRAGGAQWRQTSVLIRADIFARAQEEEIDISSECNRTLADRLGIDYGQQEIPLNAPVTPVIIAKEPAGHAERAGDGRRKKPLRPVLNAEDPAMPARLLELKREPAPAASPPKPEGHKERGDAGLQEQAPVPQAAAGDRPAAAKGKKRSLQKKGKDDLIRQFVVKKILRTDPGEGAAHRIAKDEMYQLFVRWCRSKPGVAVPDRRTFSVALKNRFVMEELTADGTQYWNNVKLR